MYKVSVGDTFEELAKSWVGVEGLSEHGGETLRELAC